MNGLEYQQEAVRTFHNGFHIESTNDKTALHGSIGIVTELGELLEAVGSRKIDKVNLKEEIGDSLWYITEIERRNNIVFEVDEEYIDSIGFISLEALIIDAMVYASKLLDLHKKKAYYGKDIEEKYEVFYAREIFNNLSLLADNMNVTIEEIRAYNIAKLKVRFPEKFSEEKALNRNLAGERQVLEGVSEHN